MKPRPSSAISLLFSLWLLLFACCGDINDSGHPPGSVVRAAKAWLRQHTERSAQQSRIIPAPSWNESWVLDTSSMCQLLIVPTAERVLKNRKFSIRRFFVFGLSGDLISDGRIIEILASHDDITDQLGVLLSSLSRNRITGFSGAVYHYDLNYRLLSSAVYKKGMKTTIQSKIVTSETGSSGTAYFPAGSSDCKKVTAVKNEYPATLCSGALISERIDYVYSDDGCLYFTSYTYLSHSCREQDQSGGIPPYGEQPGKSGKATDCMGVSGGTAYVTDCGCIGGSSRISSCSKDPCREKNNIRAVVSRRDVCAGNILALSQAITSIVPKAYGYDLKLCSLTSNTYRPFQVRTDSAGTFHLKFSWNPTDGYAIGMTCTRPRGSAPLSADIIWPVENLSHQDLVASGTAEMNQYKARAIVMVLTGTSTYVTTVKDWAALQKLYNGYVMNPSSADHDYTTAVNSYLEHHPNADTEVAGAYAVLSIYGHAVNLYKAAAGSAAFIPLSIDRSNRVTTVYCPSD